MAINFFYKDTSFIISDGDSTKAWLNRILEKENKHAENINYIFCSDNHLLPINQKYLGHDTLTDIITFDHSDGQDNTEADIFISIERVKENAGLLNKGFDNELYRVMIHGLLHLLGYNDKTSVEQQEMRKKEDACLTLR